jgi:hypothetical protein
LRKRGVNSATNATSAKCKMVIVGFRVGGFGGLKSGFGGFSG